MSSPDVVISAGSALVGVALGALLTARTQLRLHAASQTEARRVAREQAYVELLEAYRAFSRFLRTQPVVVVMIERPGGGGTGTPLISISGAEEQWRLVDLAISKVHILSGHEGAVSEAADTLRRALWELARSRTEYEAGAVPDTVDTEFRRVEVAFQTAARKDLDRVG